MSIENQVALCSQHYQKWKSHALVSRDMDEARKALNRAFFLARASDSFYSFTCSGAD